MLLLYLFFGDRNNKVTAWIVSCYLPWIWWVPGMLHSSQLSPGVLRWCITDSPIKMITQLLHSLLSVLSTLFRGNHWDGDHGGFRDLRCVLHIRYRRSSFSPAKRKNPPQNDLNYSLYLYVYLYTSIFLKIMFWLNSLRNKGAKLWDWCSVAQVVLSRVHPSSRAALARFQISPQVFGSGVEFRVHCAHLFVFRTPGNCNATAYRGVSYICVLPASWCREEPRTGMLCDLCP